MSAKQKLGGSDGCQQGGSDEFIVFLSDVHGCHIFLMTVDALFGDISVYLHDTKNGQSHNIS
jgi:hypothetical protein